MKRSNVALVCTSILGMILSGLLGARGFDSLGTRGFQFFVGTLGLTFLWMMYRGFQNARIRRSGTPVTGIVVHSKGSGMVNHVDYYQLGVQLPDASEATVMIRSRVPFYPGEPIQVLVHTAYPGRAVADLRRPADF